MNLHQAHGCYIVAGQKYTNKLQAYARALPNGWWPHWDYFEAEFAKNDWSQEPSESLADLYKQRALSIRERYDYVKIRFTGGSDSDNIARSFLSNNIHVDEIEHLDYTAFITDQSQDNTNPANEKLWAVIPRIKEYQQIYQGMSKTKVSFVDVMSLASRLWQTGDRDPYSTNYFCPSMPGKEQAHELVSSYVEKKKTAIVYGIDKPLIAFRDGRYWLRFMDQPVNNWTFHQRDSYDLNEHDELFYWHPDAIQLLAKQGHVIKNYFKKNPSMRYLIEDFDHTKFVIEGGPTHTALYFEIVKSLIYPSWNLNHWQPDKFNSNIAPPISGNFYHNQETKSFQNWHRTALNYSDEIYRIYQNTDTENWNFRRDSKLFELPANYSKMYCLGQ